MVKYSVNLYKLDVNIQEFQHSKQQYDTTVWPIALSIYHFSPPSHKWTRNSATFQRLSDEQSICFEKLFVNSQTVWYHKLCITQKHNIRINWKFRNMFVLCIFTNKQLFFLAWAIRIFMWKPTSTWDSIVCPMIITGVTTQRLAYKVTSQYQVK